MTATRLHLVLAGLLGLAGVALLAAAAHGEESARLHTAAEFLLFHAPVILGVTALRHQRLMPYRFGALALSVLILGAVFFAGDLAARVYLQHALFPMAAPIGGSLTLLGWLLLAIAGAMGRRPTAN